MTQAPSLDRGAACRRLLFAGPGRVEVIEERLPALGADEVYARTVLSGVSHGTEMAWLRGEAAAQHRTWDADRRVYLDGAGRDYPVAPGYETVAKVAEIGSNVTDVKVGDAVYLDRPHADGHIVASNVARAGLVPADVPVEWAVFWPLARVALGGVHDAAIQLGDTVVATGLGTVGLLTVQFVQRAGAAKVIGVDQHPLRLQTALSLGAYAVDARTTDVAAEVRRIAGPAGADAAIEASGSYRGLHEAIRSLAPGGRVATVASYHGEQPGLRLGEEYHRNRITLISSMTVNGCAHRQHPLWDLDRLNRTARDLVSSGALHVDGLITHRVPFSSAGDAYALIRDNPQDTIKVVLTYDN
ncbi:zinc-binding dehydrogenase [Phytohabitans flavus]|uniref:Oxidoreductase n=1 Tax=Phytohabitans flavus TaxID=1076124 RepID=A0A6F8Y5B2_9ACTN|nr:zinc-binding alcohol dehydrogenase [Phytohabitans flavus]BCB81213.1 oxidoreductase [Phytohabitans flavus]